MPLLRTFVLTSAFMISVRTSADYDDPLGGLALVQVVGALHQPLAHDWRHQGQQGTNDGTASEALFNFIFHHRAIIVSGVWDDDLDRYVEHGADFTVVLKRSRLYRSVKQTPIHLRGERDAKANVGQLIDDKTRRGKKVSIARSGVFVCLARYIRSFPSSISAETPTRKRQTFMQ